MRNKWDKESVHKEALKYNTKIDFIKNSQSAYNRARKDNYLDFVCLHMVQKGNRLKRMVYSYEFSDKSVYVGLTYDIDKRDNQHNMKGPVFNHIIKTSLTPIRKNISCEYISSVDAAFLEQKTIDRYRNCGWNILNTMKGGGLGGKEIIWTEEKIQLEANKFMTRNEFRKTSPRAYDAAIRNCILNKVCSHMNNILNSWTKEKIKEISLKYKNRFEFQKQSPNEYSIAYKRKWLDEICIHMTYKYKKKREE